MNKTKVAWLILIIMTSVIGTSASYLSFWEVAILPIILATISAASYLYLSK
ncbi:hypothetical protein [Paraferrimonas haliotis]|uniref:hypothetical protein n=1 Tax=Paraferrimonas haliotis TaxID=2013866 RepID=UPI0015C90229|nr:hypothetical protein [Paraferrimonas haliotis]